MRRSLSRRLPFLLAALAAAVALAAGVRWGTFAVGGSDSYCYVNESVLFAGGRTALELPLAAGAPWSAAASSFVPVGHRLRPGDASAVPICPPGLPLLMALAARVAGRDAVFLVVPILGALAVWLTFELGRTLAGAWAGAGSAILLACSPIFLYQIVQPMTDVPAVAWWLAAIVLATRGTTMSAAGAGMAAGIALLTRPNLFLLGPVLAAYLAIAGAGSWRTRATAVVAFGLCALPFLLLLAWIQNRMYGSPMAVGYGRPGELYAWANVAPNLRHYLAWLVETHTPLLFIGVAAVALRRSRSAANAVRQRQIVWLCLLMSAAVLVSYLPYYQFQDWWYIRFLLPAVPLLIALSMTVMSAVADLLPGRARVAALMLVVVALGGAWLRVARARDVFRLQEYEERFVEAGRFVAGELPTNAAVLTVSESGSVQYYSGRPTLTWDALGADDLDRALDFLSSRGRRPFILLEADEEAAFKRRFAGQSAAGELDWPPLAEIRTFVRVRIYDPADRDRHRRGLPVATKYQWPARARERR